jgi:phage antirepressor YoqD-like protein
MGLFDNWFGKSVGKEQPNIRFGRYSDSYKTEKQYAAWQNSLDKFEEGDHFASYEDFFYYLSDLKEENVMSQRLGDTHFSFELYQGSKKITGYADGRKFRAEAKVAQSDETHIGFMRRLLEKNFTLKYSRFALDENDDISIVFDTYLLDGSPQKLYYALNELATHADKMDDLLVSEFEMLHPIANEHVKEISETEKEIKYNFIKNRLKDAVEQINYGKLDPKLYPQAIGYILLDTIYKLDYLIKPEGHMTETFERINRDYFKEDDRSIVEKNREFSKALEKLADRPKAEFFEEMYGTTSTFGVTQVVAHERLAGFIDEVIKEHDWYVRNKHFDVALAMTGYIVGYSLFYWAVPRPNKELLHLYYEIIESDFFDELGYDFDYYDKDKFNKYAIRKAINEIIKSNKKQFDVLIIDITLLDYTTKHDFARSFLMMIHEMEVEAVPI